MALVGNTAEVNAERDRMSAEFPAGSFLRFYSGAVPLATAAPTGVLVAEITLPAAPFAVSNGTLTKQNVWTTNTTLVGTPTYFRLVNAAGTILRQGVVGVDLTAPAIATAGDGFTLNTWVITFL